MQGALSRLPKWELDRKEDDIRGWALRDTDGHTLGTVGELIVDTETQHVTKIVLADGKQYPAHDVWLGDHVLTLDSPKTTRTETTRTVAAATPETALRTEERPRSEERLRTEERPRSEERPRTGAVAKMEKAVEEVKEKAEKAVTSAKDAIKPGREREREREGAIPAREAIQRTPVEDTNGLDLVVPVIDEELEVGTRRIDVGGMRVASHIVSEPVDRDVLLREEFVQVERRAVDHPLSAAEAEANFRDATLEMRARAEQPVVDKRTHVVEEILLKRDVTQRQEKVRDTVRHTEAEVTKLNGKGAGASTKGIKR